MDFVLFFSICHCQEQDTLPVLLKFLHENGKGNIGDLLTKYGNEAKTLIDEGKDDQNSDIVDQRDSNYIQKSNIGNENKNGGNDIKYPNYPIYDENVPEVNANGNTKDIYLMENGGQEDQQTFNADYAYANQNTPPEYLPDPEGDAGAQYRDDNMPNVAPDSDNVTRRKFREWIHFKSFAELFNNETNAKPDMTVETSNELKGTAGKQVINDGLKKKLDFFNTTAFLNNKLPVMFLNISLSGAKDKPMLLQIPINIYIENKAQDSRNPEVIRNINELKPSVRSNNNVIPQADAEDIALAKKFRDMLEKSKNELMSLGDLRRLLLDESYYQDEVNLNV